jgi:hypothetical protein
MRETRKVRKPRSGFVIVALVLTVLIELIAPAAPSRADTTYSEQEGHYGVNTFTDYHNASGEGTPIASAAWVQVTCKVYDPTIASVNPDGYWYQIASSPWDNQYYAPANTFMNGDPWNGPYTHNTDWNVPDCGQPAPTTTTTTTTPASSAAVTLAQGALAPLGYRYDITLTGFAPAQTVSIECFDSVSPSGFYSFSLQTDSSGSAYTDSYCYSADGPSHWVTADGIPSNTVDWSGPVPPPTTAPVAPPTQPPGTTPPNTSPPSSVSCEQFQGACYADQGLLDVLMFNHYLDGSGQPVVLDWKYFSDSPAFTSFAQGLSIGASAYYAFPKDSDLYFSIGTFSVMRTSDQCYAIHDYYNFNPSWYSYKHWPYLPLWLLKFVVASNFDIYSSGKL